MRRHRHEDSENLERWMVSYADFVTLLFAFFVVMYAVSSVNEGKYRVLSDVLSQVFRSAPSSLEPVNVGELTRSPVRDELTLLQRPNGIAPNLRPLAIQTPAARPVIDRLGEGLYDPPEQPPAAEPVPAQPAAEPAERQVAEPAEEEPDALARVAERLGESLGGLIRSDLVAVRRYAQWLEVEIRNSILFASGSAALGEAARAPLARIAAILRGIPHRVQVEGFTDDVPISTPEFPSNWELSAARAASVVHLLVRAGVRPERMAAIGYGEFRPVADNATEEGRRRNRRVVLVVVGEEDGSDAELAAMGGGPALAAAAGTSPR